MLVLGSTVDDPTTRSCAGPTLVIGAPLAAVPSWTCPVDAWNAATSASNSPSRSDALMTLPVAILFAVSLRE